MRMKSNIIFCDNSQKMFAKSLPFDIPREEVILSHNPEPESGCGFVYDRGDFYGEVCHCLSLNMSTPHSKVDGDIFFTMPPNKILTKPLFYFSNNIIDFPRPASKKNPKNKRKDHP